jgi:protein O-mannosyl-transferase
VARAVKQRPHNTSASCLLPSAFLFLLVILAYTPVWRAGFIWDDDSILTGNPCVVGPLGLKEIWTTSAADICPLTITTLWLEHALWGLAPLPYHLVNVLLHGACAVLLWRVLRSLNVPGAWLGATLWALHPVQVESVAWITEMKNTESGLFFLLSILFFVKWLRGKEIKNGRTRAEWNYALSLIFAVPAMASKSSTVILPVVLWLCAWWMEGRWHWRNALRVIPFFLMSIAASAVSIWTQGLQMAAVSDPQWARTWPQRVATVGDAFWFYLGKLLWPHPLVAIYPRWQIDAGQWVSFVPLLALFLFFTGLWLLKNRSRFVGARACLFALAYFIAALLPVLGLIDNYIFSYSLVFDHFQYLASMGPLALVGAGLARLTELLPSKGRWFQQTVCTAVLLIFGILTWQRTRVFESHETLWNDTLAWNPNCWVGHNNLGLTLYQKGNADEAVKQIQMALDINPNYADARNNLGMILGQSGQLDEAIAQYRRAVEIYPNYAVGHYNLGVALFEKGQLDEAIAHYEKAIASRPTYAEAYNNLGNALLEKGQIGEAIQQYQAALNINPNYAEAHGNLGLIFFQYGQLDDAIAQLQAALRLNPGLTPVRDALAKAEEMRGGK